MITCIESTKYDLSLETVFILCFLVTETVSYRFTTRITPIFYDFGSYLTVPLNRKRKANEKWWTIDFKIIARRIVQKSEELEWKNATSYGIEPYRPPPPIITDSNQVV